MDKIWIRDFSKLEVIGRCGRDETNDHAEPIKSNAKFFLRKLIMTNSSLSVCLSVQLVMLSFDCNNVSSSF